jgi:hypothetical protein
VSIQHAMTAAFNQAIRSLGLPASIKYAKGQPDKVIPHVGFASVSKTDESLVNAYGVAAKIITIRADDVTTPPSKFDIVTVGAEKFTLADAHPIHCGTAVIGWKCYSTGR